MVQFHLMKYIFLVASILACLVVLAILLIYTFKGLPNALEINRESIIENRHERGITFGKQSPNAECIDENDMFIPNYDFGFSVKHMDTETDIIQGDTEKFTIYVPNDANKDTPDFPTQEGKSVTISRYLEGEYYLIGILKIKNRCSSALNFDQSVTDEDIDVIFGKGFFTDEKRLLNRPYTELFGKWWSEKLISGSYLAKKHMIKIKNQTFIGTASKYVTDKDEYYMYDITTLRNDTMFNYVAIQQKSEGNLFMEKGHKDVLDTLAQQIVFNP